MHASHETLAYATLRNKVSPGVFAITVGTGGCLASEVATSQCVYEQSSLGQTTSWGITSSSSTAADDSTSSTPSPSGAGAAAAAGAAAGAAANARQQIWVGSATHRR